MTLLEEIRAKCSLELIASHDIAAITALVNANRVMRVKTAIGAGTILGVLDLDAGNNFLDVIDTVPAYRHVKKVIQNESFDVSLESSRMGIDALVPAVLTPEQAQALKALGEVTNEVTQDQVEVQLKTTTGEWIN